MIFLDLALVLGKFSQICEIIHSDWKCPAAVFFLSNLLVDQRICMINLVTDLIIEWNCHVMIESHGRHGHGHRVFPNFLEMECRWRETKWTIPAKLNTFIAFESPLKSLKLLLIDGWPSIMKNIKLCWKVCQSHMYLEYFKFNTVSGGRMMTVAIDPLCGVSPSTGSLVARHVHWCRLPLGKSLARLAGEAPSLADSGRRRGPWSPSGLAACSLPHSGSLWQVQAMEGTHWLNLSQQPISGLHF